MGKEVASVDVFDFFIYSNVDDKLIFSIDKTASNIFRNDDGVCTILINDAVINTSLFENVMNGVYDDVSVIIEGRSIVRDIEDGEDLDIYVTVKEAKLVDYKLENTAGGLHHVNLVFRYDKFVGNGLLNNFNMKVVKKDVK